MRSAVLFTVVLVALGLAAEASAGCFATAGLTAPPSTVGPGDTWTARITVKQHGTRLIPDAKPTLTIQGENGATKTFAAKPTDEVGVYAASVVFPTAGEWRYVVNDGFVSQEQGQTWDCSTNHTFAAVTIGGSGSSSGPVAPSVEPTAAPAEDGGVASFAIVLIVAAAVALASAAGVVLARRSSRRHAQA